MADSQPEDYSDIPGASGMVFEHAPEVPRTHISRMVLQSDGSTLIVRHDDVTSVIEENKRLANNGDGGWGTSRVWRRIGTIPWALLVKWRSEDGIDYLAPENADLLKKKLNDGDYAYIRSAHWRV